MNKKEAILKSALKLLTEKGIHNTPMSAIAKEAGTGMGTIYNYFSNKDILINEIYVGIKEQEKGLFKTFEDEKPIKTQFENYFVSLIDFFLNNPLYFQFMEQLQASPIITEESRAKGLEAVEAVVQLIQIGQQERIIKSINSGELLQFIGGAMLAYLRWVFNQPAPHRQSLQNQLTMVWDAIKE